MRGTPPDRVRIPPAHGIIPAYAGNTEAQSIPPGTNRDHPRVCGEHVFGSSQSQRTRGSSPRMRGTLCGRRGNAYCEGIIPAYAGNTMIYNTSSVSLRDHPRVCGEHERFESQRVKVEGSSPRMRGTHADIFNIGFQHGIIPAYAGNTELRQAFVDDFGDHPRVCGEHVFGVQTL